MRKLLSIFFLSMSFLACGGENSKTKVKEALPPINTSKDELLESRPVDTIKSFDNRVYSAYISKPVIQKLKEYLPDWELPEPAQWEKFWFKEYKEDSTLVNYLSSDFNCDNQLDYAFLLQNKKNKQYAIWVLQSKQGNWSVIKLYGIGEAKKPLQFGIELVPKGPLSYIDFDNENPKSINLNCPGIQVSYFESAAETYYWNGHKFESVTTGD